MSDKDTSGISLEIGTWSASLALLIQKGLRFGSADGYFGLLCRRAGLFPDTRVINIDANPLYEPSLRKIRDAIGGDYRICAVAEKSGTIDMRGSAQPYWASAVPPDDPYWKSINGLTGETVTVPCRTLDSLIDDMAPPPPYAIKLDIQGFEARALRSGPRALARTAVVVSEVALESFRDVNAVMEGAGFDLHDLTDAKRTPDHGLGWFYATFLHRDHAALRGSTYWAQEANDAVIEAQVQRRADQLARIEALLARIKADRAR